MPMQSVTIMLLTPIRGPERIRHAEYRYIMNCAGASVKGEGKEENTTGNRVALIALISALKRMTRPSLITVLTDSMYLIQSQGQLAIWQQNGWIRTNGVPLRNADLWEELMELQKNHAIRYRYENIDLYYEKRQKQKEMGIYNDLY